MGSQGGELCFRINKLLREDIDHFLDIIQEHLGHPKSDYKGAGNTEKKGWIEKYLDPRRRVDGGADEGGRKRKTKRRKKRRKKRTRRRRRKKRTRRRRR